MGDTAETREQRRLREVASEYRKQGYRVSVRPSGDEVPAEFANFQPDLIATRGPDKVLVEVKTRETLSRSPELRSLVDAASEIGWRFELVLTNPVGSLDDDPLDRTELVQRLDEATSLQYDHPEAAFLLAWSTLEGAARTALRKRAVKRTTSPLRLLKTLYSLGGLSKADHEWIQQAADTRSRIVHGLQGTVPRGSVDRIIEITTTVLDRHLPPWDLDDDPS